MDAERVVRSAYQAFAEGDFERMLEYVADDVVYHVPEPSPWGGDYTGKDALRSLLTDDYGPILKAVSVEVADLVEQPDGRVAVRLRVHATVGGEQVVSTNLSIHQVSGGQITESWSVPFDEDAAERLWKEWHPEAEA